MLLILSTCDDHFLSPRGIWVFGKLRHRLAISRKRATLCTKCPKQCKNGVTWRFLCHRKTVQARLSVWKSFAGNLVTKSWASLSHHSRRSIRSSAPMLSVANLRLFQHYLHLALLLLCISLLLSFSRTQTNTLALFPSYNFNADPHGTLSLPWWWRKLHALHYGLITEGVGRGKISPLIENYNHDKH